MKSFHDNQGVKSLSYTILIQMTLVFFWNSVFTLPSMALNFPIIYFLSGTDAPSKIDSPHSASNTFLY